MLNLKEDKKDFLCVMEAVPQLLLALKILLLFGFRALSTFLFCPILNCWRASMYLKFGNEKNIENFLSTKRKPVLKEIDSEGKRR